MSKSRVKRDNLEVDKFDKRAENLAYRSTKYDDPQWDNQWYLVRLLQLIFELFTFYLNGINKIEK